MKIVFSLGVFSFLIALAFQIKKPNIRPESKSKLSHHKPESVIPVHKQGIVSSFSIAGNGKKLEERKTYDQDGVLVSQETYLDGMKFGPQRYYKDNVLRQATFIFGEEGEHLATVRFDEKGVPGYAVCVEDVRLMKEIDLVCGFEGPYQVRSDDMAFVTVRENGKVIHQKGYLRNGSIFTESKMVEGNLVTFNYRDDDGSVYNRSFRKGLIHHSERYSPDGKLESKELSSLEKPESYFFQYDEHGSEKAVWLMTYSSGEMEPKSCVLFRSVASHPARPERCPKF